MNILISLIVEITSQCIHISKCHMVYLKYKSFLFVKKKGGGNAWVAQLLKHLFAFG